MNRRFRYFETRQILKASRRTEKEDGVMDFSRQFAQRRFQLLEVDLGFGCIRGWKVLSGILEF